MCSTDNLRERYARQIMLPDFGEEGQRRLLASSALVVGVGGLGSAAALYLTAAGVGRIGLIDADVVSESNLQRQVLYTEAEVGLPKVERAHRRLEALNAATRFECIDGRLTAANAAEIVARYDAVVDGCDNFATRYVIDDACAACGKPYVYGTIGEFQGQVSVFNYRGGRRYADLYPEREELAARPAKGAGVMGATPGVIGCIEASETVKLLSGCGEVLRNRLFWIDLKTMQSRIFEI